VEQKLKDLEEYIKETIANVKNDRAITHSLLTDLIVKLKQTGNTYDSHKELGQIAAKYVETLQRSNDQLVRITSLLQKRDSQKEDISLSNKDKDDLFDLIQGSG
jgi:polyhydroxyalkanoate synthesis regulator protein